MRAGTDGACVGLGDRMRQVRGTSPMRDFAARVGVTGSTVCRWEAGTAVPNANDLTRLITEFDVDVWWLLMGDPEKRAHKEKRTT